jgi:hypothetical protein
LIALIHLSYSLNEVPPNSKLFNFVAMSQFDCPITPTKKEEETMEASHKTNGSTLKPIVHSLWPTYIGERRTRFAKAYGIKVRCYGEHFGEHIENLMRTYWEREGNIVGTRDK